ncbi:FAD-dependent oxidoreductase [Puniceicoccus vermicola]|uniref:FAD-dependent oxidoreductase n=1 Tax=Puniceicoccus vermicola TaxID=388746 RepID=A0A7X1E573_9BACT|nr:FAD-dependent oxidoreductase [Puniceicoccus vermicola]MBC2602748.1 FAD-dependent oxidoreductase [Puniceicoccus vermicola]
MSGQPNPEKTSYDLIVVGAGSGGFGAALAAARQGCRVLLVEKSGSLGGNAVRGGVNVWEPGVGGTGIPFELYKRLKGRENAVAIYSFGRHVAWESPEIQPHFPGGELVVDPEKSYLDTLRRFGAPPDFGEEHFRRKYWHGVLFEPDPYAAEMESMLRETGRCTVRTGTAFSEVHRDGRLITGLTLDNGEQVTAHYYVDATAHIVFARAAGEASSLGRESRSLYGETGAPPEPSPQLNGASLIFRVSGSKKLGVEPLPDDIPSHCWWQREFPAAVFAQSPAGDYTINPLPTMAGLEVEERGYPAAYRECLRRTQALWHHIQVTYPEFQNFRKVWVAPALGVREGPRMVGRYVLTEHDLDAGLSYQNHNDLIAISDHAKDTHGDSEAGGGAKELNEPYGIPYRCLLPRNTDNLLVACRGASFSSIAASSCRLSRTMMQLGQAAGTAAAIASSEKISSLVDVPPESLRQSLIEQRVELSWPRSPELNECLRNGE